MIGRITRLDDEEEKKQNEPQNAPAVIEKALFDARVVMLTGEVNDGQARRCTERLLALDAQNAEPILFVISSPGGHVESGDMTQITNDAYSCFDAIAAERNPATRRVGVGARRPAIAAGA